MQPRLAARHAGEAHAERRRLRVEAVRKRRRRRVRHQAERHDHRRIAGLARRCRRRSRPGNSSASSCCAFITSSMPCVPPRAMSLRAIGLVARAVGLDVHLVRDVELRLPVLDRAGASGARCSTRAARSASSPAPPARATASHALKSRFMPYLKTTEQSASLPLRVARRRRRCPRAGSCRSGSASTTLGMSAGSTTIGALLASGPRSPRPSPSPASAFSPPRGSVAPGGVDLVVEERARDADARALEPVARSRNRV